MRQFAVLSWAGGSRHLRAALLLVCGALSGKRYSALFCIDQDLSDVLPWCLTSSRESSGSGWSVSHGSCIFNVPISPWHDLHLLIFFWVRAVCAFDYVWKGTTLPSLPPSPPLRPPPSPHPTPPSGGVGGEWGGGSTIQFDPPLHVAFSPLCTVEIHAWSLCPLRRPFFSTKKASVSSSPATMHWCLATTRRVSEFFLLSSTVTQPSASPRSVRSPALSSKNLGSVYFLPNHDYKKMPVSHPYYTAHLPRPFLASTVETDTYTLALVVGVSFITYHSKKKGEKPAEKKESSTTPSTQGQKVTKKHRKTKEHQAKKAPKKARREKRAA